MFVSTAVPLHPPKSSLSIDLAAKFGRETSKDTNLMQKAELAIGEYYHIYNRGVDKRIIFSDEYDIERFILSMIEFNALEPIGSLYEKRFSKNKKLGRETSKLAGIYAKGEEVKSEYEYVYQRDYFRTISQFRGIPSICRKFAAWDFGTERCYSARRTARGINLDVKRLKVWQKENPGENPGFFNIVQPQGREKLWLAKG